MFEYAYIFHRCLFEPPTRWNTARNTRRVRRMAHGLVWAHRGVPQKTVLAWSRVFSMNSRSAQVPRDDVRGDGRCAGAQLRQPEVGSCGDRGACGAAAAVWAAEGAEGEAPAEGAEAAAKDGDAAKKDEKAKEGGDKKPEEKKPAEKK